MPLRWMFFTHYLLALKSLETSFRKVCALHDDRERLIFLGGKVLVEEERHCFATDAQILERLLVLLNLPEYIKRQHVH